MDGMIIITEVKSNPGQPDYNTGDSWRYILQSHLFAVDPDSPGRSAVPMTENFFSACSPEISFDGKFMLFAGQQKQDDPWQIWEMDLGNMKSRQVTSGKENSIDPAYLPGGVIIFSRSIENDSLRSGHALVTCNLDGSDLRRITFNPHSYFATSVLKDGRVISISRQLFPSQSGSSIMVLRPDGTKSELFYPGSEGKELYSRGWETEDGHIVFIESGTDRSDGGELISVSYNRPLHTRTDMSGSANGDFCSVFPLQSGNLLVSYRSSADEKYALYEFDASKMLIGRQLYKSADFDVIDAVLVTAHERPKKLPSEVDFGVKTGLLLCQNINITGMQSPESSHPFFNADRVEIVGIDSSLGVIEVARDGSFYLKVPADTPFRIITMDKDNKVVMGPGSWLWLRPNERRGCVGCHEDNEMVPANRYSLAVSKEPVVVPVHISGVKEKEVELE